MNSISLSASPTVCIMGLDMLARIRSVSTRALQRHMPDARQADTRIYAHVAIGNLAE